MCFWDLALKSFRPVQQVHRHKVNEKAAGPEWGGGFCGAMSELGECGVVNAADRDLFMTQSIQGGVPLEGSGNTILRMPLDSVPHT